MNKFLERFKITPTFRLGYRNVIRNMEHPEM